MDTNDITRSYLDQIQVEERLIGAVLPDLKVTYFGRTYDSPIMTPAFSHLKSFGDGRLSGMEEYALAAHQKKLLNWVGMEPNESYAKIAKACPDTVRIIKPYKDHGVIQDQMAFAKDHGAVAVGVDIDHVFGYHRAYDVVDGAEMGPVTEEDLSFYAGRAGLPFIVKGVLSATDAVKAADCGAAGIVVSHHHGRLPFAVPPLKVLPAITEALEGRDVRIFVDCHIDTGADAFKALALGADGVSVGRALLQPLQEEGLEGAKRMLTEVEDELAVMMAYTGADTVDAIDRTVLWNL